MAKIPDDSALLAQGHRKRLRERFLNSGAEAVADYELLEMMLFAAHPRGDVKPLAKRLIAHFGSFGRVMKASPEELAQVEGAGESTIAAIKVTHAAAARMLREEVMEHPIINSWTALLDYCHTVMSGLKVEELRILFLNHKHRLIRDEVQQRGTVNHTPAYPREVVKRALELGASAFILVHNHPSGDPSPSKPDIDLTMKIQEAARAVGITLHDHLIIGAKDHYSFKSNGLI
jgi:DNA repair protein RadC